MRAAWRTLRTRANKFENNTARHKKDLSSEEFLAEHEQRRQPHRHQRQQNDKHHSADIALPGQRHVHAKETENHSWYGQDNGNGCQHFHH